MTSFVTPVPAFSPAACPPAPTRRVTLTDEPLPFDPLADVPWEAQSWLWDGLLQVVEETIWDRAGRLPSRSTALQG